MKVSGRGVLATYVEVESQRNCLLVGKVIDAGPLACCKPGDYILYEKGRFIQTGGCFWFLDEAIIATISEGEARAFARPDFVWCLEPAEKQGDSSLLS